MGALDEQRADMFRMRYDEWDADLMAGVPAHHFATHYSSSGVTLQFLLRNEPWTSHAREFQGGRFDHADRLFHSLESSWESASCLGGLQDVRELIPQLYVFFFPFLSLFALN